MIWFVSILPLPILVAVLARLVPSRVRRLGAGYALAASLALVAALIILPQSAGWPVKARYHLLSDTPLYVRLAVDGLTATAATALLLVAAWDVLVRQVDGSPSNDVIALVVTSALLVFMSANALTLLLSWSGFGLLRAILAANDRDARSRPVIASELGSLTALLAAMQPLGLAGLSAPTLTGEAPAMTGWLVLVACALRMGIYPLQAGGAQRIHVRLASTLTGLYLLLRTAPAVGVAPLAFVLLATVVGAVAFRSEAVRDEWPWLLQHAILLGALAATLGSAGGLPGLALFVCVSLCQPALLRLQEEHAHPWDLMALLALGGMVPTVGWAAWTRLLGPASLLGPRWAPLLLGCSFALCACVLGHGLRQRWASGEVVWRRLLRWQDAWRSLPALAVILLGVWPNAVGLSGQAPPWQVLEAAPEPSSVGVTWPLALGIAVLTTISFGLGWLRPTERADERPATAEGGVTQAVRASLDSIERIRKAIADVDITLRDHATLAWTALAATALLLWLRGR